jgi:hypothetical protein
VSVAHNCLKVLVAGVDGGNACAEFCENVADSLVACTAPQTDDSGRPYSVHKVLHFVFRKGCVI